MRRIFNILAALYLIAAIGFWFARNLYVRARHIYGSPPDEDLELMRVGLAAAAALLATVPGLWFAVRFVRKFRERVIAEWAACSPDARLIPLNDAVRAKRIRRTIRATLSLILLIAASAFWLHSDAASEMLVWRDGWADEECWHITDYFLQAVEGSLYVGMGQESILLSGHPDQRASEVQKFRRNSGIHYFHDDLKSVSTRSFIFGIFPQRWGVFEVPFWLVCLLALPAPILWLGTKLASLPARREAARAFCRKCGYDLRATPIRCPECGTPVPVRS